MATDIDHILDCLPTGRIFFLTLGVITPAAPVDHVQQVIDRIRQR